ncbi:MAG: hypothetical protein KJ056_13820, partial [Acidimicrobiia bacterium]|nr:hypothetical protein [Acidimicrobiia bacterium]
MINNRMTIKCERCGASAHLFVHANGFDDAPESFTMKEECTARCAPRYQPMSAEKMHERTGLPLAG